MNNNNTISKILFCFFFLSSICCFAQNSQFNSQRAEEDYSYLKDSTDLKFRDAIKYIALNKKRSSYLSMGGSIRTTYDNYENEFWVPNRDLHYYSQRVAFHTNWQFGKNFRAFGELQSGIVTGDPIILYSDDIDVHQAFVEYKTSSKKLALRLGRQEMEYGSGRLYSLRQGPNIRQTFDMGRVLWKEEDLNLNVFYGNAVQINFDAFDNPSYIFKRDSLAQRVWGVYSQFKILPSKDEFNTELYYLGFNNEGSSRFSDVTGEETRHTIGLRKFGTIGQRITHNHELIYQFGKIGGSDISAFNLEVMWQYQMINTKWKPAIALKIDWSSGDSEAGDGKINSFNPLFVNPSLYGHLSLMLSIYHQVYWSNQQTTLYRIKL